MLFNSFAFLLFFPVVTIVYFLLPHRFRWFHLLAASCYFYAFFIPKYLFILLATIVLDYFAGLWIEKAAGKKRQWLTALTVIANIGLLSFFKYYHFFLADANELLQALHLGRYSLPLTLLFPIGLSFHTFQALSYILEVNRGRFKAERHFGIYALYVMFYPQLVAGPIERPQNMLPQFYERKSFDAERIATGLKIMLWGFFKKIVIADRLALYVSEVYKAPEDFGSLNIWLAVLVFFPFQVYCDFSGYSSIALGTAKVMGFDLMENFRRPFSSITMSELWSRWHISLSTWLRDYLYQPLVAFFRQYGKWAIVLGLMITFAVSGFWHGAGFNFILYGLVQGVIITIEFWFGIRSVKLGKTAWGRTKGRTLTYCFFALSLVFFRSANAKQAFLILQKMFWDVSLRFTPLQNVPVLTYVLSLLLIGFLLYFENNQLENFVQPQQRSRRELIISSVMVTVLLVLGVFHQLSFIYFQF